MSAVQIAGTALLVLAVVAIVAGIHLAARGRATNAEDAKPAIRTAGEIARQSAEQAARDSAQARQARADQNAAPHSVTDAGAPFDPEMARNELRRMKTWIDREQ